MTWAELMEANEAFDELLDLKEKAMDEEKKRVDKEIKTMKLRSKSRSSRL